MVGIDELGTALARLPVSEPVTEHPSTNSVSRLEDDDVKAFGDEHIGTPQAGETAADDRHVEHVSVSSQNSVGCSAMMRRGTPGHGT